MKENSIEEDIKILKELGQKYYKNGEIKIKALSGAKYIWALQNLLSDYKKVLKINEVLLKENEELKEDRKNNNEMIALAQNEILNYMSGYEEGKKHKMTAVAQVVENQQYYRVRKQMEKYEELIKMLQKENEELKEYKKIAELTKISCCTAQNCEALNNAIKSELENQKLKEELNDINQSWIQKVQDKIEEYKNMLKTCNKAKDIDRIKAINERILELQELLEGRE